MNEYDPRKGVPKGCWYLVRTVQFGDFEVPHEERIVGWSRDRDELVETCRAKGWECLEAGNCTNGWPDHRIARRRIK